MFSAHVFTGTKVTTTPLTFQGYYNIGDMLSAGIRHGAQVGVCGTCLDARGIAEADLAEGAKRGSMDQLTEWTVWADKVIVF